MTKAVYNLYLCHYGVPGMKWGQRKASKSASKAAKKEYKQKKKANPSAKKTYNTTIKRNKKTMYSDISSLSTKELQERVNRMNLERQYSSLLKTQKSAVSRGKQQTANILEKTAKDVASQKLKKVAKKAVGL